MASLFTPESEKARGRERQSQAEGARTPGSTIQVPGTKAVKSEKSGDSLGNPNSPGYEPWGKKKKAEGKKDDDKPAGDGPAGVVVEPPRQGPEIVRLSAGWEALLLAQRKICEKAKAILTLLEGPDRYSSQKKSKVLQFKSRGCILDLDLQEVENQRKEAEALAGKEKKTSA
jgi:hypothetical protein